MLLLVGGTTMAFLNGAYPNYLAHLANNGSHSATNQVRGVDQRNGNNAGSSALDVVTLKKDNINTQNLEQEGPQPTITFTTKMLAKKSRCQLNFQKVLQWTISLLKAQLL